MAQDHPISRRDCSAPAPAPRPVSSSTGSRARPAVTEPRSSCDDAARRLRPADLTTPPAIDPTRTPTSLASRAGRTGGTAEIVYVRGRVLDQSCKPVTGALVEIWQANSWGRYDHEGDAGNPRPLDPNFQSWAEMLTDKDGGFRFKTIKPGAYPADDSG